MKEQIYETYWKLTVEYTNIHSYKFIDTLKIIIDSIDENNGNFSKEIYEDLQRKVNKKFPKADFGSVRKSINQFVKLGFINYELRSYHKAAKEFINTSTDRKRQRLFSEIFYTNASFNRSVTNDSNRREINFLIKTLENNGILSKKEIEALMLIDINDIKEGYADRNLINSCLLRASEIEFKERKYNQIGYLYNFLNKLDDVRFIDDNLFFCKDTIIDEGEKTKRKLRDPYLHRLYKFQLKEESKDLFSKVVCMVEKLDYPVLIASHIKPFIKCSEDEAYDSENGILLSKNIDSLFDLGYITFSDDGQIICSNTLSTEITLHLSKYNLSTNLLSNKRIKYLDYHRNKIFRK